MRPSFGIGTFAPATDETAFAGLVVSGGVVDLREHLGADVTTGSMLQSWDEHLPLLHSVAAEVTPTHLLAELRPLPPVQPASQIFCAGANYHRHLHQMVISMGRNNDPDRARGELEAHAEEVLRARRESDSPFVFSVQASALSGAEDDVVLWGPGSEHDWELELVAVIGRRGRNVSEEDALEYVAGYTIGNDISTRDVMNRPNLTMTDFLMTKGRPTFKPVGPFIVPREFVPDYRSLRITLSVNGEVMQDEGVDDIIYGVERLVSYVSEVAELCPGDLLFTGSPAGNAGHHGDRWLRPGDVLEGEITGLGRHHNRCVDPEEVDARQSLRTVVPEGKNV